MTSRRRPRALVLSGAGRHGDPWHPFASTSERLATIVAERGCSVDVCDDVDVALATLDDDVELIVVNAGDPWRGDDVATGAAGVDRDLVAAGAERFERLVDQGVSVLAVHAAASALRDVPAYERMLGARWMPGTSWHPPIGECIVRPVRGHPLGADLPEFAVVDERYADLRIDAAIDPIVEHVVDGARHPAAWTRRIGQARLVYDALGHDGRSYDAPGHRALLERSLAWLLRG